ncbi:MAG: helix-turn-helix domain-containing protein [Huintestinicola sp.]
MYDFGLLLKELREQKGLTQAQLAEKISRTKTVISKYENNTQFPTLETLIDLSVIFNVSLDYLAGVSEKSALSLEGLSDEQKKILISLSQNFRNEKSPNIKGLTDSQLKLLNDILKQML